MTEKHGLWQAGQQLSIPGCNGGRAPMEAESVQKIGGQRRLEAQPLDGTGQRAGHHQGRLGQDQSEILRRIEPGLSAKPSKDLVGRGGFEPPTNGLKVRCSTS